MIWNDDGGSKEKVRSSGGRSFQRRGAVTDMALLENVRRQEKCLCVSRQMVQ